MILDADEAALVRKPLEIFASGTPYDADAHAALVSTAIGLTEHQTTAEGLQRLLTDAGHYAGAIDGDIGPASLSGLRDWALALPSEAPADTMEHHVFASSFADPADVARFKRCKANGGSDQHCYKVGDNALGFGIYPTEAGTGPCCALPPEDTKGHKHFDKLTVTRGELSVVCDWRDAMPSKAHAIEQNGCLIDLNPDACAALGLTPPVKAAVTWRWA